MLHRLTMPSSESDKEIPVSMPEETASVAVPRVLSFRGNMDTKGILTFRDEAFTAIGLRPSQLILDVTEASFDDTVSISTLITVVRVAKMVKVPVRVRASLSFRLLLEKTNLTRLVPLLEDDEKIVSGGN